MNKKSILVAAVSGLIAFSGASTNTAVFAKAKDTAKTETKTESKAEAKGPLTISEDASTSKTVKQGDQAVVAVKTEPGAKGSIDVKLKSGSSQNKALTPQKAGADGMLKWTWTVAKNTAPGAIAWTVEAKDKNRKAEQKGTITVEEAAKPAAAGKAAAKKGK